MTDAEKFHTGDVLTVPSGILVSPTSVQGVYKILDWLTGEAIM